MDTPKKIEKIIRESAFDEKKKKRGLKFSPGLALTGVQTTGPRVLQPFQEKLKTILIQNFGGQIGCIMGNVEVAYVPILKKVLSFKTVAIFIPDWQLKD